MEDEPRDIIRAPAEPPTFRAPRMVSRPKPKIQLEEELGPENKLGDFEDVQPLSVSEARAVISAIHEKRKQTGPPGNPLGRDRAHNDSQTVTQFVEYLENFSKFKVIDNLNVLFGLLDSHTDLSPVEKALLGSLTCDSADEAKTLIPSLANKFSDEELQPLLDEIQKLREHKSISRTVTPY
ncbi:HRDC-like protein [Massariosphaeria phaeospora]|uniref:HRDC-like protein n=1 Tax=Massariosphaeria phaeospora TaxID=100035 RepID=A0A7C8IAG4_9PLEO|nr:HRDC-like protein [Massariosphaeria phaeospora]